MLIFCDHHHAAALADIHGECFVGDAIWSANFFSQQLQNTAVIGLAEYDGKNILSFGIVQLAGDSGDVLTMATRPNKQAQGFGKKIMTAFVALMPTKTKLWLEVDSNNAAAISLYKKIGFTNRGVRADYYGAGKSAILLMLEKKS